MHVLALICHVGAIPVETIELFLNSIDEVSASDNGVGCFTRLGSRVCVEINVYTTVVLKGQVVTVFALLSLLANSRLEVPAKRSLKIDCKRTRRLDNKDGFTYRYLPHWSGG
jgi:hypothetical protein